MRGKDEKITLEGMTSRITPAYAGKSPVDNVRVMCYKDHPRLCGEKIDQLRHGGSCKGSPPPMRGKAVPKIG